MAKIRLHSVVIAGLAQRLGQYRDYITVWQSHVGGGGRQNTEYWNRQSDNRTVGPLATFTAIQPRYLESSSRKYLQ